MTSEYAIHRGHRLDEISVRTFHDISQLRQEVFVVEQDCVYLDLDGRDAEPGTTHYWVSHQTNDATEPEVAATLRVLSEDAREPGLRAIGRVATAMAHRGKGLAASLMEAVVADHGHGPLVLEAQTYLTDWYTRFGFEIAGDGYLEDGIPHTPMRRG